MLARQLQTILIVAPVLLTAPTFAGDVHVVPNRLDLGEWPAGRLTEAVAWLVNDSDQAVRLTGVEDNAAVQLAGTEPVLIPPGSARDVRLTIRALPHEGDRLEQRVRLTGAGVDDLTLTVVLASAHPGLRLAPATAGDGA